MKKLILFSMLLLLMVCACENPLHVKSQSFNNVTSQILFNRSILKTGDDYSIGYSNGNIRSNQIRLTWQKCTDRSYLSYKLFRNGQLLNSFIHADSIQFVDSLLAQDEVYNYRLITYIRNGMAVQDTILLKTPQLLPPSHLEYTFLSSTTVKVSWENHASFTTGYEIERIASGSTEVSTFHSTNNYIIDNDFVSGTTYRYRVKAENDYESTAFSPWEIFNLTYTMAAPSLHNLMQAPPSNDVNVTWNDNSTAETGFIIYRAVGTPAIFVQIGQTNPNVTEYLDTSEKTVGQQYFYYIQAYNANDALDSNVLSITIIELPDQTVTIGTGTNSTYEPMSIYYAYHRSAAIYLHSEIGGTGTITSIGYQAATTTTTTQAIKIYIRNTSATELSPAQSWPNLIAGLSPVWEGNVTGSSAGAWCTIVLTTPYVIGGDNTEILVETNNGTSGAGGPRWYYTSSTYRNQYIRKDNSAPVNETGTVNSNRPNIQLTIDDYLSRPAAVNAKMEATCTK